MIDNSRERIEEFFTEQDEYGYSVDSAARCGDLNEKDYVREVLTPRLEKLLHQELQKARHDWLREEIVRLEKIKEQTPITNKPFELAESVGKKMFIDELIQCYQSELDQPNK